MSAETRESGQAATRPLIVTEEVASMTKQSIAQKTRTATHNGSSPGPLPSKCYTCGRWSAQYLVTNCHLPNGSTGLEGRCRFAWDTYTARNQNIGSAPTHHGCVGPNNHTGPCTCSCGQAPRYPQS